MFIICIFLSLVNLNVQAILNYSCTKRRKRELNSVLVCCFLSTHTQTALCVGARIQKGVCSFVFFLCCCLFIYWLLHLFIFFSYFITDYALELYSGFCSAIEIGIEDLYKIYFLVGPVKGFAGQVKI